jgi:hypothetical protein
VYRTVTLLPRRYLDPKTGDWQTCQGYDLDDLPALIFALQKAQAYAFERPIIGLIPPDERNPGSNRLESNRPDSNRQ